MRSLFLLLLAHTAVMASSVCPNSPVAPVDATPCKPCQISSFGPACGFYLKLGTGVSFSKKVNIFANPVVWDLAVQGYNSRIGNVPIIATGVGIQRCGISGDVTLSYRPQYKYRKYQTAIPADTIHFLGDKTREFDLDLLSLFFTLYHSAQDCKFLKCCKWDCNFGSFSPLIGSGIGITQVKFFNFRATGLPTSPDNAPLPGFGSENQYTIRYEFAYQFMAGVEFHCHKCFTFSTGYRFLHVNKTKGPRFFRDPMGEAFDTTGYEWIFKNIQANEVFIELKIPL